MVSEIKEPLEKLLEQSLVFKIKLITQIVEFTEANFDEKDEEVQDLLKQCADYDYSAQTVRKIQRKYTKSWF